MKNKTVSNLNPKGSLTRAHQASGVIEVRSGANTPTLALSHVVHNYPPGRNEYFFPPEDNVNTLSSSLWGCYQMAQLYKKWKLIRLTTKYVPSVPFTTGGTVAVGVVSDPLDSTNVAEIKHFVNAPMSYITPIHTGSKLSVYSPRDSTTKYTYNSQYISNLAAMDANPGAATETSTFMQAREQEYGGLHARVIGGINADGSAMPDGLLVGHLFVTMSLVYYDPVPIESTIYKTITIFPANVYSPPAADDDHENPPIVSNAIAS